MKAEQITEPDAEHGEGPVWSPSWGGLRWVDTFAGDLLALGDDGTVTKRRLGTTLGALRPRVGGGMVVALERQFAERSRVSAQTLDAQRAAFREKKGLERKKAPEKKKIQKKTVEKKKHIEKKARVEKKRVEKKYFDTRKK